MEMDLDDTCEAKGEEEKAKPISVILVGAPGSGKSTFCEHVVRSSAPPWVRVCQNTGATNKPQELDDAALRRLVKRIYIPLPDENVRRRLLKHKLKGQAFSLPGGDLERLVREMEGYSGSDLQALCEEAAMMPIRELGPIILTVKANQLRPLRYEDFPKAMFVIRPSLNGNKWEEFEQWNREFCSN